MTTKLPRRALVVIDVQQEYVTGNLPIEYPPVGESIRKIAQAMDAALDAGIPTVVVQQSSPPDSPLFATGSPGWELVPEIQRRNCSHYIRKVWPSVFTDTDFEHWLNAKEVNTLVVVGFMTHNCDMSTIVHAVHKGMSVEFLSDASGSVPYDNRAGQASAEEIHRVFSVVLQSRFAAVLTVAEWLAVLRAGQAPDRDTIAGSNKRARDARARAA